MMSTKKLLTFHLIFYRFDHRAFRWMMTMVFAVEEINKNSSLLPGVKLGYKIMDSCDHVHTSLQALFSLVSYSKAVMTEAKQSEEDKEQFDMLNNISTGMEGIKTEDKTKKKIMSTTVEKQDNNISPLVRFRLDDNQNDIQENATEERMDGSTQYKACLTHSPVSAVIGLASSSPTRAVAHTLGPFNLPLVNKCATICNIVFCCCLVLNSLLCRKHNNV